VVREGTGVKAKEVGRPVYGKTGTTNDFTDAWFIGFDEDLAVGVWVGRDDHTPIGNKQTGAVAALPIWIEFMKKCVQNPQ
jgi:penicillin-binding protein 1A